MYPVNSKKKLDLQKHGNIITEELYRNNKGVILTTSSFSNFLKDSMIYLRRKIKLLHICDVLMVELSLGVDPTQSYWANTKKLSKISF